MTDISNNLGAEKIKQMHNLNSERSKVIAETPQNYTKKEINNLDNDHSVLLGRSMVKKMEKGPNLSGETAQNIKQDLAELYANPELIKQADALFEAAIRRGYSYKEAAAIAREFVDFHK